MKLAQTPDLKSPSGYPKMVQKQVTAWIELAAEKSRRKSTHSNLMAAYGHSVRSLAT